MEELSIYRNPAAMEPLMPTYGKDILREYAFEISKKAGALHGSVHPVIQKSLIEVARINNCYYSNLIEGHHTNPFDIERALKKDYSKDPSKRMLQQESIAHIEVQKKIEEKLEENADVNLFGKDFICWIHGEFYNHLPEDFLTIKDERGKECKIIPGQLRKENVTVGRHLAPDAFCLEKFLNRFEQYYSFEKITPLDRIIAIAASHHRFAWIHPFLDGNGRVVRLLTDALLLQSKIDSHGIWTLSRGLARHRDQYRKFLEIADQPRRNDLDGRGNLSDRGLFEFCEFFLKTALDQIEYMNSCLDLDTLMERIKRFVFIENIFGKHNQEGFFLLREALFRGQFNRGEASQITNKSERLARDILKKALEEQLLCSDGKKRAVRLGFPTKALAYYFPRFYPKDMEPTGFQHD